MLCDDMFDIGCGIKLFECSVFFDLLYFDYMYCYLLVLMQCVGWKIISVLVNYCYCIVGVFKYNNFGCVLVGICDLCGVVWLII